MAFVPITLLKKRVLFQIPFQYNQFENYQNLSSHPETDCFFQTICSLGLRNDELSKKESEIINQCVNHLVKYTEAEKYLSTSFGIKRKNVCFTKCLIENKRTCQKEMNVFFMKRLQNNHATILTVDLKTKKDWWGHYMVVYKTNDTIFFFDPQSKGFYKDVLVNNPNIYTVLSFYGCIKITGFGYFKIKNVNKSLKLLRDDCPVEYHIE